MRRVASWLTGLPFQTRLWVAIFIGALAALLFQGFVTRWIGTRVLYRNAEAETRARYALVERTLGNQLGQLEQLVEDNSYWTDIYEAVARRDLGWLEENIYQATWGYEPTIILVTASDGTLLGHMGPVPQAALDGTAPLPCLREALAEEQASGFYRVNDRLTMVSASKIFRSDESGSPVGVFLMARYVDDDVVAETRRWAGEEVVLCTESQVLAGGHLPQGITQTTLRRWHERNTGLQTLRLENGRWAAAGPLRDSEGNRVGTMAVVRKEAGFDVIRAMDLVRAFAAGASAIVLALLLGFQVSRMVVRPMKAFADKAACLARGDLAARLERSGSGDAFDITADSFNVMAADLERAFQKLEDQNQEIEAQLQQVQSLNTRIVNYSAEVQELNERLQWQYTQMETLNARLSELAQTDGVTGLLNHRAFHERLNAAYAESRRYVTPLGVLMIDVDFFKRFNDELGHPAGDEALRAIANLISGLVRESDFAARYGGEEFAVGLPHTDLSGAMRLADRIRVGAQALKPSGRELTVSVGVGSLSDEPSSASDLIVEADNALYAAKHLGRNRVELAPPSQRKTA
jgi:diguanylate cyclase (GGDEF)-like protein